MMGEGVWALQPGAHRKEHFAKAHSLGGSGFPDFCLWPCLFLTLRRPGTHSFTRELVPSSGHHEVQ